MSRSNGSRTPVRPTVVSSTEIVKLTEALNEEKETHRQELTDVRQKLEYAHNNVEIVTEALAELELALEDTGWQRLSGFGDREFSLSGLRKLRRLARLAYLKNPLIRHAVNVQSHYVWGQDCTISASAPEVNDLVQGFLDDPKNTVVFTGHQARLNLDIELQVDGELFFPMFTNVNTGRVIVRRINPDEIIQIISNPNDYMEPWFYKRIWTSESFDVKSGTVSTESKTCYYPDWRLTYNDDPDIEKPKMIGADEVIWDAPIYHVKVGGFGDQKRGCPEIYSALDWARAVKEDLEDYATIRRAHSRFAFTQNVKGGKAGVAAAKQRLNTTMMEDGSKIETNPPPVSGAIAIQAEGWGLQPFKTAGMVPSPEEGRRLWLMVSAGTGIPETILSGNADVGNLATAKTLDRPTELQMENRRTLWADVYVEILNYAIDQSIKAPNGVLDGQEITDQDAWLTTYELDNENDREIDIRFPSILRHEILPLVQAIVTAATLGGHPSAGIIDDRSLGQLLYTALGENDYDDIIAAMFPEGTLTFNAGLNSMLLGNASGALAGDDLPGGPADPNRHVKKQGTQSNTSDGLPPMGGRQLPTGAGITFDPGLSTALAVIASLREARGIRGGKRGRSGMTIKPKKRNLPPDRTLMPPVVETPGFTSLT